jgi:hypothetical protein
VRRTTGYFGVSSERVCSPGPIARLRDRDEKSEGAVASWRPSIGARAATYSLNSSTQRPGPRIQKRCKSAFDHALPVRAKQIRGLEHEQPGRLDHRWTRRYLRGRSKGYRAEIQNDRREKMQITETHLAGSRIKMRLAEITPDTQKEVAALELSVELSKLRISDGAMVVPNPQRSPLGELQVRALRYICEGLCQ